MYGEQGEQGEHKHVFEYKSLRLSEHLVITVPHKKQWGTESPSQPPGNIGCSHCSPVPPIFFHRHIWGAWQSGPRDAMSLLSDLLEHMPPTIAGTDSPKVASRTDRPRLALVERPVQLPGSTYTNAANATPEWRQARNQYINHVMACPSCYAPTGRHCASGADLRASYDRTPMESPR